MNKFYEDVKSKALASYRALAKEYAPFEDANMLLGAAEKSVSLTRSKTVKTIDTEWITKIEEAIPELDTVIRRPMVAIEDVDEVLPVELSKHITEKSIKHLAQHTNYILDVKDDGEVVPQKILNVFHEETYLTYENKFVNTLLSRLSAFVDKRLRSLGGTSGVEMDYKFDFSTEFEHLISDDGGRNSARINLRIELTSPLSQETSESDNEINERYSEALNRIKRINMALISYRSSSFAEKLGKNYIRPPVIRTNAILKNKNLRELLNLWEYIEGYDKVGYSFVSDKYYELPSDEFVGGMYSSAALQYLHLYSGISGGLEDNRLISEKHLFDVMPEFDDELLNDSIEDYHVYDSEYKKTVPVSRLMNNRKKLSEDEKKIREALLLALREDERITEELLRQEEARRLSEEEAKRLAEEEAKRIAEEKAKRRAEQRAKRLAEKEAKRLAEEEAKRLAEEEAKRFAEEEAKRLAEEEAKRLAEEEAKQLAEQLELMQLEGEDKVEELIEEQLSEDKAHLDTKLDDVISSVISGHRAIPLSMFGTPLVSRGHSGAVIGVSFVFKGGNEKGALFVVPYTREEYIGMPRKKKKRVLTSIKALLAYSSIARLLAALESLDNRGERINERIEKLRARLSEKRKSLPTSPVWEEAVKRVVK